MSIIKRFIRLFLIILSICVLPTNVLAKDISGEDDTYIKVSKTFSGIISTDIPSDFYIELKDDKGITYILDNTSAYDHTVTTNEDGEIVWNWKISGLSTGTYQIKEYNYTIDPYTVEISGYDENELVEVAKANITVDFIDHATTCRHNDWSIDNNTVFVGTLTRNRGVVVISVKSLTASERLAVSTFLHNQTLDQLFRKTPVYFFSAENNQGENPNIVPFAIDDQTITYYQDVTDWPNWSSSSHVQSGSAVVFSDGAELWMHVGLTVLSTELGQNADINITNKYTTKVSVNKTWDDFANTDNIRPSSVIVKLLADNIDTGKTIMLSPDNETPWSDIFTDLPIYDESGKKINYTVEEIVPAGYNSEISGSNNNYTIKNIHTPTTNVSGEKTWEDNYNPELPNQTRPTSITINLLAGDTIVATKQVEADSEGNWKYSFTNLPKFNESGSPIIYTVKENPIPDYYAEVDNNYNIKNTYIHVTEPIEIVKNWVNHNPENKITIVVSTVVDNKTIKEQEEELSANNCNSTVDTETNNTKWSCTLDLPKYYYDGDTIKKVEYKIIEKSINDNNLTNNELKIYDDIKQLIGIWHSEVTDLSITNTWEAKPVGKIELKKVSFEDRDTGLNGAVFVLYRYIGEGTAPTTIIDLNDPELSEKWVKIGETTSNPYVIFNNLYEGSDGKYRLIEIVAPGNYILPRGQWAVSITPNGDGTLTASYSGIDNPPTIGIDNLIYNQQVPEMPSTGGFGIYELSIFGLFLMMIGTIAFAISQRKLI